MIYSKLSGESNNIIQDNVIKLKEIFPEIVTEDKIDFDKLKLILGNNIDENPEKYNFTWPGKTQAIKESQKTSSGTLRPCKEESKNWDSTENVYIEGDNLEVLKLLQKGYYNKIKMIYIDPPYNTGKDFIYKDNYQDNLDNYLKISGQLVESNGERESFDVKLTNNTETMPNTWLDNLSSNQEASKEIKSLFNDKLIFDTPKPVELIKYLINLGSNANDIILDFFAGSSTTAEAIFKSNSKEYSNKKFILVQIPESTNEKSIAYNEGYTNICEIGKERIRRAGDKILEESDNKDLDVGFKVFKLDSSNLEKWDPDYNNLEQTLLSNKENIKPDRTELDLIYEIMIKYGIDLSLPIEKLNNIYSIGYGALLICLEDNITKEIVNEIINLKSDDISRIVFKESGFKSDADKTNIKETLRINNIDEFITI